MKKFILDLLNEKSSVSMARFLSAVCVLTACFIVIYGIYKNLDLNGLSGICSTFLGFGLGAKVVQKNFEKSSTEKGSEISTEK